MRNIVRELTIVVAAITLGCAMAAAGEPASASGAPGPDDLTAGHQLLLDLAALAEDHNPNDATKALAGGDVSFHEDVFWDGESFDLSSGQMIWNLQDAPDYPGFGSWNDRISSIEMGRWGYMTFLWEGAGLSGHSLLLTADAEHLAHAQWNDTTSSIRVMDRVGGLSYGSSKAARKLYSAPTLVAPMGAVTSEHAGLVHFAWNPLAGVETYRLAIKSATDDTYVLEVTTNETEYTLPYIIPIDQKFRWWVRAEPSGAWSAPGTFWYSDADALYYSEVLASSSRNYYSYRISESLLSDDPENLRAIFNKAVAIYWLAGSDAAVAYLESLQLSTYLKQQVAAAIVDIIRRDWNLAVGHLDSVLPTSSPEAYFAYYLKGYALRSDDRYEEAKQALNLSIAENPDFHLAYFLLGYIHKTQNNVSALVDAWAQYLELTPYLGTQLDAIRDYINDYLSMIGGRGVEENLY